MTKRRFHPHDIFNCLLVSALLLLVACGGGGGFAGGGIGGTGVIASGPVTAKGSIFVNGVEYDTSTALVTLNGALQVDDSELRRGMVVRVDGNIESSGTTGTAASVFYEDVVEGPLTAFSAPAAIMTLTVLGQSVVVEEGFTFVDNGILPLTQTLPDFAAVAYLEVSGHRDASATNGAIRATYIRIESALSEYEVKGVVENGAINSFDIAGLHVLFAGIIPADGTTVAVKGLATGYSSPPATLEAASVEIRTAGLGETEFEHAEIEGFISNFTPADKTFTLNGQVVNYAGARFEAGLIDDLVEGLKVEAEGPITGGILVADKIEFKESIRLEGDASDSDADGSFTVDGLPGLMIFVDPVLTQYDAPATVVAGDHLRIRGREIAGPGNILATEIRFRSAASRVELQAPVTAFTLPPTDGVTLMNTITVDTTGTFTFGDLSGLTDRATFYGNLTNGDLVKARGDLAGPDVNWTEIELEK